MADYVIYTWAGPEIAVATTKGYTTQVAVLAMLAIYFAEKSGQIGEKRLKTLISELKKLPSKAQRALDLSSRVDRFAEEYHNMTSLFFIGRNLDYASCLEGSLKLKEISYIHSEAYAAGELKHGTIALIEEGRLVVALCCYEALFDKSVSNIQQVKARGAKVLALANEGNRRIYSEADDVLLVPRTDPVLLPIIEIIPLQLFAYFVAKKNGCDIDKPKNLAKSVTVE
jgi:glucosamine--fructose-6-phosphate aminotransferase (isomerizing)